MAKVRNHCYANVPIEEDIRTVTAELEGFDYWTIITNKSKNGYP